jgi:hypothetical protein
VNFNLLRLWSVPIIAGVIGGTVLARYAPAAFIAHIELDSASLKP